jgi:ABC-type Zn uptake system ZnuABC Zn-binding protein ZnuA
MRIIAKSGTMAYAEDALDGDTLGPPGSDGGTYLKMIRHNTRTIVSILSGS